jgi:hypothetical protein
MRRLIEPLAPALHSVAAQYGAAQMSDEQKFFKAHASILETLAVDVPKLRQAARLAHDAAPRGVLRMVCVCGHSSTPGTDLCRVLGRVLELTGAP